MQSFDGQKRMFISYIEHSCNVKQELDFEHISNAINQIRSTLSSGHSIWTMGNGGSAHTASHAVTDWSKLIFTATKKPSRVFCINDNIGSSTAYANDFSFEESFKLQIENYALKDDLVVCFTGSGNSQNVVNAISFCNEIGINSLLFVGFDGGRCKSLSRNVVHVESSDMQIVEDTHLFLMHLITKALIES